MDNSSATQKHSQIKQLINSSRLQESFTLLKNLFSIYEMTPADKEKLKNLETTYKYLLQFMSEGKNDPERGQILDNIRDNLLFLNDLILRNALLINAPDSYSAAKRMENLQKASFSSRLEVFRKEFAAFSDSKGNEKSSPISQEMLQSLNSLFNYVWTIFGAPHEDYEALQIALIDDNLPEYVKSLLISAILLGSLSYFDSEAFSLLLDLYEADMSAPLKARINVTIFFILLLYSSRISLISDLKSRLTIMREDEEFNRMLGEVMFAVVRTYDTKRVTSKMRDEVLPGLMKINPDIIQKLRDIASDSDDFLSDRNPEWEEMIEESGLQDKIREINDMQMEGSDVMMTTFANLKGFPFFNQVSNWFLPFIPSHPELMDIYDGNEDEAISLLNLAMCDSDIYSFLFSLKNIPESRRKLMIDNMKKQMEQAQEVLTSAVGDTYESAMKRETAHFLQDMYRFYNLYRKRSDFYNPFSSPIDGERLKNVNLIVTLTVDSITKAAEFYFKYKYYSEAASLLELSDSLHPGEIELWEKIGYCYDRLKNYSTAVEWYKKAEILNPDNLWVEKKLAVSMKNAGRFREAVEYYEKVLAKEPDNYHILMSYGEALLEIEEYQEAIHHFFHAQYLKPEKKDPKRAIAWTNLISGNPQKAIEAYEAIIQNENPSSGDYLNAGLCVMALQDYSRAIKIYGGYLDNPQNDGFRGLITSIKEDMAVIKKLGISLPSLRLVIDKLRYDRLPS